MPVAHYDAPSMNIAVPFPEELPAGYEWLPNEIRFDPNKHLALEPPTCVITLAELGYSESEI